MRYHIKLNSVCLQYNTDFTVSFTATKKNKINNPIDTEIVSIGFFHVVDK